MFSHAIIASAALMASTAVAQSVGKAVVVNKCSYPVFLCNTPAADGGYSEIPEWLDANTGTYEQQWTELTNGNGWSIKLANDTALSNIMQYEYTFHNDGQDIIWYDLSDVNGNPWDQDWEITASSESGECNPKQQAYRYATDDAYGMQACPQDSIITVTLCSGDADNDDGAASASSSVASETSAAATETSPSAYTYVAPSTTETPSAEPTTTVESTSVAPATTVAAPSTSIETTTFATSTTKVHTWHHGGYTVTEVATQVVTNVVYETSYAKAKRNHQHHGRRHAADRA